MKTFVTILFLSMLAVISCKKDSTTAALSKGITYPDSVYYGKNILYFPDSTVLLDGQTYGLGASLQQDATLSLIFTNLSGTDSITGHQPVWFYGNNTGWIANTYNTSNNTQKFTSAQKGKIDLQISFQSFGIHGRCKIDFYENSTGITHTKYLRWQ
jgi:hypothetical protein